MDDNAIKICDHVWCGVARDDATKGVTFAGIIWQTICLRCGAERSK